MNCISWKAYHSDPRPPCKYYTACYQKNPNHLDRFKHPPESPEDGADENDPPSPLSPSPKRRKIEDSTSDKEVTRQPSQEDAAASEKLESSDKESEEEFLPDSPLDIHENLKQKFLVEFPQDFFDFWDFCSTLSENKPEGALSLAGLTLCGPYDLMGKKKNLVKNRKLSNYLCHWRFYYDPPEFQTLIAGGKDEYHIGYFRDDPSSLPDFVGSMSSKKAGTITQMGGNIFAAVYHYLDSELKTTDVFKKCSMQKLAKQVEGFAKEKNYPLDLKTQKMKERNKKCVSKSFHGAGIVVPVDKENDVGYREIPETNANLKKILQKIANAPTPESKEKSFEVLHELLTNVQFANDEGDFGMGLELGIDLLTFGGKEFHSAILHLLTVAYDLLDRGPYAHIIKAHLKNRLKGSNMNRLF